MTKTTLVIMAAGMGSRFGGIKQLTPIGKNGEVMIDYSIYDAIKAGFDKIVFIIKKEIEADFKEKVGDVVSKHIPCVYVYQNTPPHRTKPYGTGEAILSVKDVVDTPFAIINADDYYGREAFQKIHDRLVSSDEFCMVGYKLCNTLTENGSVSRGICTVENGYLKDVVETHNITFESAYAPDTIVSMNMWGLTPKLFPVLEQQFNTFLSTADISKDEFYIPYVVDQMVKEGLAKVRMLTTDEKWYGVTYKEDKETVSQAIQHMDKYPEPLWQ